VKKHAVEMMENYFHTADEMLEKTSLSSDKKNAIRRFADQLKNRIS
jgi:hypothetical protein